MSTMHSPHQWEKTMPSIQYDKVYAFDLTNNMAFGDLTEEEIVEVLSDGRPMSHLIEVQLTKWFPELTHVRGCKDHDHIMERNGKTVKLDAKNFTRRGCKFMPSSMIGTGRTFDKGLFNESVKDKDYIICDITQLPKVHVKFKKGTELAASFPKGKITKSQRGLLF